MNANIEELVDKYAGKLMFQNNSFRAMVRNALTEQAEAFKGELQAYDGMVRELTKTVEDMQGAQSVPEHIRSIKIPTDTMEQEFQNHYRRGYEAGKNAAQVVPVDGKHPSHTTRSSDASSFDEVCIGCGAKDISGAGWGDLAKP